MALLSRHPGRIRTLAQGLLLALGLGWAAGGVPLAADGGEVAITNNSTVNWALQRNSKAWADGMRAVRSGDGPGGGTEDTLIIRPGATIRLYFRPGSRRRVSMPLVPASTRRNPYGARVVLTPAPSGPTLELQWKKRLPPGYLNPFTRVGGTLTIIRNTNLHGGPGTGAAALGAGAGAPARPASLPPAAPPVPGPPAVPRPGKRRAPAPPVESGPEALPEPTGRRVEIQNQSAAPWVLELEEAFGAHNPILWAKHPGRRWVSVESPIDIVSMEPERHWCEVAPGATVCATVPAGRAQLRVRLWDTVNRANPYGLVLQLDAAGGSLPSFALTRGPETPGATALVQETLAFAPDRITLRADGWPHALVVASPPGAGRDASPRP